MSRYFTYRSLNDLRSDIATRSLDIDVEPNIEHLLQPLTIASRTIGNRLAVHPMEGCDGTLDGRPDELTFRRWQRFGDGGAKLIWGEATAVVPEARANPRQLLLTEATAPDFARLVQTARDAHKSRFGRDDDLLVGLQLTHSGRWSYPTPLIARHSLTLDPIKHTEDAAPLTDAYLEQLEDAYVRAAVLARAAGFDFVDVKQCHTYLLNELLAAHDRPGPYGGSFENRTRFVRNVVRKIRAAVGDDMLIATRLNVYDGPRYSDEGEPIFDANDRGFGVGEDSSPNMTEPLALVGMLRDAGVSIVNVTLGSPYFNPHIGRPFERAPVDGYAPPEHPLVGVARHFSLAAEVQRAYPDLAVIGTGYSWLRHYAAAAGEANVRAGRIAMMGLGRGALAYPDFAADLTTDFAMHDRKSCIGVSYCTALMRAKNNDLGQFPAGCAPRDPLYAEQFKLATRPSA